MKYQMKYSCLPCRFMTYLFHLSLKTHGFSFFTTHFYSFYLLSNVWIVFESYGETWVKWVNQKLSSKMIILLQYFKSSQIFFPLRSTAVPTYILSSTSEYLIFWGLHQQEVVLTSIATYSYLLKNHGKTTFTQHLILIRFALR